MSSTTPPDYPLRARGFLVLAIACLALSPTPLGFAAIAPVVIAVGALDHVRRKAPWIVTIAIGTLAVTASIAAVTYLGYGMLGAFQYVFSPDD